MGGGGVGVCAIFVTQPKTRSLSQIILIEREMATKTNSAKDGGFRRAEPSPFPYSYIGNYHVKSHCCNSPFMPSSSDF